MQKLVLFNTSIFLQGGYKYCNNFLTQKYLIIKGWCILNKRLLGNKESKPVVAGSELSNKWCVNTVVTFL